MRDEDKYLLQPWAYVWWAANMLCLQVWILARVIHCLVILTCRATSHCICWAILLLHLVLLWGRSGVHLFDNFFAPEIHFTNLLEAEWLCFLVRTVSHLDTNIFLSTWIELHCYLKTSFLPSFSFCLSLTCSFIYLLLDLKNTYYTLDVRRDHNSRSFYTTHILFCSKTDDLPVMFRDKGRNPERKYTLFISPYLGKFLIDVSSKLHISRSE